MSGTDKIRNYNSAMTNNQYAASDAEGDEDWEDAHAQAPGDEYVHFYDKLASQPSLVVRNGNKSPE